MEAPTTEVSTADVKKDETVDKESPKEEALKAEEKLESPSEKK